MSEGCGNRAEDAESTAEGAPECGGAQVECAEVQLVAPQRKPAADPGAVGAFRTQYVESAHSTDSSG